MSDDKNEYSEFHKNLKKSQEGYTEKLVDLLKKAEVEQTHLEREDSFHFVKGGRRDIVVHCVVTVLPRVNGKRIIGDREKELPQLCFEIPASKVPMKRSHYQRAFAELMTAAFQQIMKIGGVRE